MSPGIYGTQTLEDIHRDLQKKGSGWGISLQFFQSNHEGDLIDKIHEARSGCDGIILNPGAFTHYSYAIRDAVAAVDVPVVEVHLSNVHAREDFRKVSVIAPVAAGQISGFGAAGYEMALYWLKERLNSGA